MESIDATGLPKSAFNPDVIEEMPSGVEQELEIHLVPVKKYHYFFKDLFAEMDEKGYKFADPVAMCALYEKHPSLDPSITMWFDKSEGMMAFLTVSSSGWGGKSSYMTANHTVTQSATSEHLLCCVKK